MANTGLLFLSNPTKIAGLLPLVLKHVNKTLYIHWNPQISKKLEIAAPSTQIVGKIYFQAAQLCENLDVRVLLSSLKNPNVLIDTTKQINVLLCDEEYSQNDLTSFKSNIKNIVPKCPIVTLEGTAESEAACSPVPKSCSINKTYEQVVLGGTFDRLHNGHKILLSEAVLKCTRKLTVGVTDTNMLLSKKLWELIEPISVRIEKLRNYLEDIDPTLTYDVVPIQDPFGPTKSDPHFQMIVVSSETIGGGKKVNEIRILNNLRTLEIHSISLVSNASKLNDEEDKISSSNYRMRLLGTRLKSPTRPVSQTSKFPYVIGLTGGIASGKSSIGKHLASLGAGLIDCDKIAHELYKPGTKLCDSLVDTFGTGILMENKEINRKALGEIVFNDKMKLQQLNSLVWPAIAEETIVRVKKLYDEGYKIIVIEAAVLLRAGWDRFCNDIWVSIIPPEEAVRRLVERNNLSEEDARSRLTAQPTNCDYVNAANIVFSTFWSYEFTEKQVNIAWNIIKNELEI